MTTNKFEYLLPEELSASLAAEVMAWRSADRIGKIWAKDASVWTGSDEDKWLGWLHVIGEQLALTSDYEKLTADAAGFDDVLLMGMGGSSLCPEVLAITFGKTNFCILDSTVPAQVKTVEEKLDLERTLFIVASKSGSTLEPNCFKQYFFERLADKVGRENAGKQFIAITDPGSKMEQIARDEGFRHIFYGKPEVGGRFSALSAFGMTAAASMGLDTHDFLSRANDMAAACRESDPEQNPGALLGLILGLCHKHGRDKLTIFTDEAIYDLGAWLEQLIAESTGKNGVAIIPVDREKPILADRYTDDRVFAFLSEGENEDLRTLSKQVEAYGHPTLRIELESIETLGQEFFRWEFATAVAGAVMGINPFDQPDVESAKIEARKLTDKYEETGELPGEEPFFEQDGIALYTSPGYAGKLFGTAPDRSLGSLLQAHIDQISPGDYFAVLGYIEMNDANEKTLTAIREKVLDQKAVATCLGLGPRFLHSTGQAYKGGANNGVFLQITSDDALDLPVPGQKYTFGVVKAAQARGDFQVLLDRDRRALRIHLNADVASSLEKILAAL